MTVGLVALARTEVQFNGRIDSRKPRERMSTVKRNRHFVSKLSAAIITASVSLASVAQTERLDLPDMGASADTILSRAEETEYAKALVRQMRAYEVLNEDPLIAAFFEDMGFRLASNSSRPDKSFTFVVINQMSSTPLPPRVV